MSPTRACSSSAGGSSIERSAARSRSSIPIASRTTTGSWPFISSRASNGPKRFATASSPVTAPRTRSRARRHAGTTGRRWRLPIARGRATGSWPAFTKSSAAPSSSWPSSRRRWRSSSGPSHSSAGLGDRKQEVATLLGLANVYNWGHKIAEVLATVNGALAIAIEIGDTAGQAGCHALRGEARGGVYGPVVEAMRDSSEALRLAREVRDSRLLAQCLTFAGRQLEWYGEYDVAVGHLREGLELARREHSGYLVGLSLYHLGHAALARGDYEGALGHYRSLLEYAEAAGDKLYLARLPNLFGGVSLEIFDLDEAIRLNAEGDETSRRLWPWPEPRGHSLWKLGLAHLYRGNHGSAERAFREAESLRELDTWVRWTWEV